MLQSKEMPYPSKNNKRNPEMAKNADGSIDLYRSGTLQARSQLGEDGSRQGWFGIFRLYGPGQEWFDRTWKRDRLKNLIVLTI